MLIAACATRWPKDEVVKALGRVTLVCRGPKPIAALKEVGLAPALGVVVRQNCVRPARWTCESGKLEALVVLYERLG
jgi:hypothetical protein